MSGTPSPLISAALESLDFLFLGSNACQSAFGPFGSQTRASIHSVVR